MDEITKKLIKVYEPEKTKKKIIEDKTVEETGPYSEYNLEVPASSYLKKALAKPKEERNFIERSLLAVNKNSKAQVTKNQLINSGPKLDKTDKRILRKLTNSEDVRRYASIFNNDNRLIKQYLKLRLKMSVLKI